MVGGPSEVFASSGAAFFCAGMNPPSLKDLLRGCLLDVDGTARTHDAGCLLDADCSKLAGIDIEGTAGMRCCCPLTSRTTGGSDNFH